MTWAARNVPIRPGDILVGRPLAFNVVSADGTLLLSKGRIVPTEDMANRLLDSAFRSQVQCGEVRFKSVFERVNDLANQLVMLMADHADRSNRNTLVSLVKGIAQRLVAAVRDDRDMAFAAMHLELQRRYDVVHSMMAAVVCICLADACGVPEEEQASLAAAALTHDIALLRSRASLDAIESLTPQQWIVVGRHHLDGVELLQNLGVVDELWLTVVREHHEHLDGSGYLGMQAADLTLPSRIMRLADAFSAMLRPRPYRDRMPAQEALADLYADERGRYDSQLLALLIRRLGIFPPGTMVQLANREMALVTRPNPSNAREPFVAILRDGRGRALYRPIPQATDADKTRIVGLFPPERVMQFRAILPACWTQHPAASLPEGP